VSLTDTVAHDIPLDWHCGTALGLWADTPLTKPFSAGVGIGVFVPSDTSNAAPANAATSPAGVLGVTLAYALGGRWDIVLVGLGYRF